MFLFLFVFHHRAHRHCSHGVSRIRLAKLAELFFAIPSWLYDTAAIPFLYNLGLKSKKPASAVRRQLEVNRFNTLTL